MVKLSQTILLVLFMTVACEYEHLLSCVKDDGNVDVSYNGSLHYKTFYANATSLEGNQTIYNLTVCVYNNNTAMSLNTMFDVSCRKHSDGNVSMLSVKDGLSSNADICFDSVMEHDNANRSSQGFLVVTDSPPLVTFDPHRPMATLAVIDRDGYIVNSVTSNEELRLRVQTLTDEEYSPPIIGQCWYKLSAGDQTNRTVVKPSVMFVEYGCSVQNENQLILTNQDLFYINGLMEKVSYPFDLSRFYQTQFDFIQITCEVYYCTEVQYCRARCPPSQTTYQVSGHPKRLNLSTEVYVVFSKPTTKQSTTKSGILFGSRGTTSQPSNKKSTLEEYQPYFLIGTLILTALSLCVMVGFLTKFICRNRKGGEIDDTERHRDAVCHTNIHIEEHGGIQTKDNYHLLDQNHNMDTRQEMGFHGNSKIHESTFHGNYKVHETDFHGNPGTPQFVNQDMNIASRYNGDQRFVENLHFGTRAGNSYHGNQIVQPHGYMQNNRFEQDPRLRSGSYNNQMPQTRGNISQNDPDSRHPIGYHGNWIPRPHTNTHPQDRHGVQGTTNQVKPCMGGTTGVSSPPPAYISKTNLKSTPRSQGMVNYGFEGDRTTLQSPHHGNMSYNHGNLSFQHGNSRMESRGTPDLPVLHTDPQSPVGGELYPWQDFRQSHFGEKPDDCNLRQHRSDTALLNNALREYFDKHGMLK